MSIHLIPSTPAVAPDAAPLAALRHRRPLVLHEVRTVSPATALVASSSNRCNDNRRPYLVTQQGQSSRRVIAVLETGTAPTPIGRVSPSRMVRAAMETLHPFTESGELLPPAPKAIVTFSRPWFTRQPGNKGRVGSSVSIAVSSDGESFNQGDSAYVMQPGARKVNPLPVMAGISRRAVPVISIIPRLNAGNIIAPERITVSTMQRPSELQLIADQLDNIIPFVRRKFEADGIDDDERTILDGLHDCSNRQFRQAEVFDLTTSLDRVGLNKRNARRLRELFPELGPGAA